MVVRNGHDNLNALSDEAPIFRVAQTYHESSSQLVLAPELSVWRQTTTFAQASFEFAPCTIKNFFWYFRKSGKKKIEKMKISKKNYFFWKRLTDHIKYSEC